MINSKHVAMSDHFVQFAAVICKNDRANIFSTISYTYKASSELIASVFLINAVTFSCSR